MNPTLPTYFSNILQRQWPNAQESNFNLVQRLIAQVLIFVLIPSEKQKIFLNLVEDPTIWEPGKKDSLNRDK